MRERGLHVRLRQAGPIPLDAELSCGEGQLLALIGPSGSGKEGGGPSILKILEMNERK